MAENFERSGYICVQIWFLCLISFVSAYAQGQGGFGSARPGIAAQTQESFAKLAEDPACRDAVKKYCRGNAGSNNLAILECLQNDVPKGEEISDACEHVLWNLKKKLSTEVRFETAAGAVCRLDLEKIDECKNVDSQKGFVIPCLIDKIDDVKDKGCKDFLTRMEAIVFSDYRLVYKFVQSCGADIERFHCGRLEDDDVKSSTHAQGSTISCLSKEVGQLKPDCKKQILRVAELQSNDYHKDRQLYFACRDDRENLCRDVISGEGRIFKCLAARKFDGSMSKACREKLTTRQKLEQESYKVNHGVKVGCKSNIESEKCVEKLTQSASEFHEARMSGILLCLENASRNGRRLEPECIAELRVIRKNLMADYQISPEIVSGCGTEIKNRCGEGLKRNGKTIHCLMNLARNRAKEAKQLENKQSTVVPMGLKCLAVVGQLMKEVDIRESYAIDPVLQEACASVVQLKCYDVRSNQGKVIDCLMNLVDKGILNEECKDRLMETQYFVSRDFELSPGFLKACAVGIQSKCNADPKSIKPEAMSSVLLCLYRQRTEKEIAGDCVGAVKRVMLDRAKSVDLEPAVELACMDFLSMLCSDKTGKNEEMTCLEDNYEKLNEECKKVLDEYIEEEDEVPDVSQVFVKSCELVIKEHCKEALVDGKDDEGDSLMKCLIKHKHDTDVPEKCLATIEHHQLITLKDFTLSHDFREACKDEVGDHCKAVRTKFEVVSCLSEIVRNDTFNGAPQRLGKMCRNQLKFELFQRSEKVDFDPELKKACANDMRDHCSNVSPSKTAMISCLRNFQPQLDGECRKFIFRREQQEAIDPTTDFALMTKCKGMIKKYCENEVNNPVALFACLRQSKKEQDFDKQCLSIIIQRQRTRAQDVRLNPDLWKDCQKDITNLCRSEYNAAMSSPTDVEGKVIGCLRAKFAEQFTRKREKILSDSCSEHIRDMVKESALDYMQDVALAKACKKEINANCSQALALNRKDPDGGHVEECLRNVMMKSLLKHQVQSPCWKEVVRVLAEDKSDIQVDPLLHRACSVDLLHVCKDVVRGEGRQMSCLVEALGDNPVKLRKDCQKALNARVNLWNKAMELPAFQSFSEMASQMSSSPARNYLMTVMIVIVLVIFVGGMFCGRVTKRVARQIKNR